jgi:hypothetical protein
MMKTLACTAAVGALSLGLAACGDYERNEAAYENNASAYAEGEGGNYAGTEGNYTAGATASGNWPAGTRIVVENGVTYRVGPDNVRVALGPSDSRILVEDGVRFRVDPGGSRVRIDETGAEISAGPDAVDVNTSVGNTSVTVNTQ